MEAAPAGAYDTTCITQACAREAQKVSVCKSAYAVPTDAGLYAINEIRGV